MTEPVVRRHAMRIGEVIGRVTLSRHHASLPAGRLLIARPLPLEALGSGSPRRGEDLVVFDDLGAGAGSIIGFSEGREAANPFGPAKVPIDAYSACILDRVSVD
jgi:microcompartment protein CcmK/EutM